jgi:hypothetical protein
MLPALFGNRARGEASTDGFAVPAVFSRFRHTERMARQTKTDLSAVGTVTGTSVHLAFPRAVATLCGVPSCELAGAQRLAPLQGQRAGPGLYLRDREPDREGRDPCASVRRSRRLRLRMQGPVYIGQHPITQHSVQPRDGGGDVGQCCLRGDGGTAGVEDRGDRGVGGGCSRILATCDCVSGRVQGRELVVCDGGGVDLLVEWVPSRNRVGCHVCLRSFRIALSRRVAGRA